MLSEPIGALAVAPVTLSIVSHGQGSMLKELLKDIKEGIDTDYHVILTLNIPEDEAFLASFSTMPIQVIRNSQAQGFGQNHNQAFRQCQSPVFVIVNPDIRGTPFALTPLLQALEPEGVGAVGPQITSSLGHPQDSARHYPTMSNLLARHCLSRQQPDYVLGNTPVPVDWVAGMLIAFKSSAYRAVGGFDEEYFMYVEDADIAWRLKLAGYQTLWVPSACFIHDAQHGSRKKARYLMWHLHSMARFLLKRMYSNL